jgi:hypothetical protein
VRRWPWRETLVWLGVAGAALIIYANGIPWAYLQVAQAQSALWGAPGMTWGPLVWMPVTPRDGIITLLVPIFGLGDNASSYVELVWRVSLPAGFVLAAAVAILRRSRLAAVAYIAWLVIVTVGVAVIAYAVYGRDLRAFCVVNCDEIVIYARRAGSGGWLALAALAPLWAAAGARVASWRGSRLGVRPTTRADAVRALFSPARLGALVYTAGAAVWFFGFIFTPYATQGCTGFPINWAHFVSGACAGLDANDALGAAWALGEISTRMYIVLSAGTGLMMLVALIAVWQRGWFPPVIATIWAALATWLMALALHGLPALLRNPPGLSVSTAPWVRGAGPTVTIIGALLVWAGAVVLWTGIFWRRRRAGAMVIQSESAITSQV